MSRTPAVGKHNERLRVVLFGMECTFTAPVLEKLAQVPRLELDAIVFPGNHDPSPTGTGPVSEIAQIHSLRTIQLTSRAELVSPDFRAELEKLMPDVVVVACFPWRLPGWILTLPRAGCVNVHPSLLPEGSGPEPIFWAFRWGLETTGVTLHLMDEGLDSGPILSQGKLAIPDGATMHTLEQSLAALGAKMLVELLALSPVPVHTARLQDHSCSRYARFLQTEDLNVTTSWNAAHAARFINGVAPTHGAIPVLVVSTGQRLAVDRVVAVDADSAMIEPVIVSSDRATIRFSEAVLHCRLHTSSRPLLLRSGFRRSDVQEN